MEELALLPQWVASKQQTLPIRLIVHDKASEKLGLLAFIMSREYSQDGPILDEQGNVVGWRHTFQCDHSDLFEAIRDGRITHYSCGWVATTSWAFARTHYSRQTRRFLAVKQRELARRARYGKGGR